MPFSYILFSKSLNRYYIGCTEGSVEDRLAKHLTNHKGFTAKAKDWEIKLAEPFTDFHSALMREKQLKAWKNRTKIEELVQGETT